LQAAIDKEWVTFAHTLADAAGEVARRYFRMPVTVEAKSDASPVTQADKEIETVIRSLIQAHFPDHGIFGEEHGRRNEQSLWQWVIDPIDGTRAFIAGYPLFTTLIALAKDGVPLLGLIDQPVLRERWTGVRGSRTQCNGKEVFARGIVSLDKAVVATTSAPYHFSGQEMAAFDWVKDQCAHVVQGGDAYGYAMLASGHIDVFIDSGFKPYDFCALKPVIEGAGGIITDWEGNPLTIESEGHIAAAATHELHKQVIAILQQTVT
jgi:inositol-phosphate phosphatase / L-galactose 1-phosphate phosphatase / histidinol-phosphatase